jgi:protein involved in polysaccharide export with SLBB domain
MIGLKRALCVAACVAALSSVASHAVAQDASRLFGGDRDAAAAVMGGGSANGNGAGGALGFGGTPATGGGGADQGGLGGALPGAGRTFVAPTLPAGVRGLDALDPTATGTASRPLPPLEPNDFQKFVKAGTGRLLPMFGSSLFEEAPGAFAPVGAVPVPADYVVGPGDEIIVRSTGVADFEMRPVVDRDGQIVLPKVGAVQVAGVRVAELEKYLTAQVGKSFRNFTLSATLGQLRGIDVYVVGQARRPGKYTISSLSTLVNALFVSGGPNANGSMRRIRLVRSDRSVVSIDLYDFVVKGDRSRDVKLLPGDTIVFPPAGPRVAVTGATNVPAVFELLAGDTPLREVLALSGGLPVLANPQKAQLERVDPAQRIARSVEEFALDEAGLGRRLRDGDVLTLFPISPQFSNAVTLRGNVAMPLRYPHKPGMRVRDLIPEREALITRDYYLRKNMMVQFEDAATKGQSADVARDAKASDAGQGVTAERARQEIRNGFDEVNWEYAVIERLDPAQLRPRLIPFNLGRAVLQGDEGQNLELQPGDIVTVFSQRDLRVPREKQTRMVRIEGEVAAPGIYSVDAGETLPQLISRIGGTTREAYLFGTELTRESVRAQQQETLQTVVRKLEDQVNAGIAARQQTLAAGTPTDQAAQAQRLAVEEKIARDRLQRLRSMRPSGRIALELDPKTPALPPITLEDGDRVVVPARPSFVSVVGSVFNENSLLWRDGRNVETYLQSAGPTDGADIDNVFVLRADGSIASRRVGAWVGGGVGALTLAPGDTVVVPEKVDRETKYAAFMRGMKDWTQVIYQLGLGAAAIKVLRD